jgi:hypothetical protein
MVSTCGWVSYFCTHTVTGPGKTRQQIDVRTTVKLRHQPLRFLASSVAILSILPDGNYNRTNATYADRFESINTKLEASKSAMGQWGGREASAVLRQSLSSSRPSDYLGRIGSVFSGQSRTNVLSAWGFLDEMSLEGKVWLVAVSHSRLLYLR